MINEESFQRACDQVNASEKEQAIARLILMTRRENEMISDEQQNISKLS